MSFEKLAAIWIALGVLCLSAADRLAAQMEPRHTFELGVVGQTTEDLITPPYTAVTKAFGQNYIGTPHEQAFGGPQIGYRYAFTSNFSLEGHVGYLFGHQPTVRLSGGNELLVHAGIRTTLPLGRLAFFASVAPGLSSFSQANRFIQPASTPSQQITRVTHFSVEKSVGITYRLAPHTALSFSVSEMSLVEGDEYEGYVAPTPCVPPYATPCGGGGNIVEPGNVEDHLLANLAIERSFGRVPANKQSTRLSEANDTPLRNEVLFLWANQPQTYLSTGYLAASNGFGANASHAVRRWLDLDAAVLELPGGDAASYQDGGSQTEVFAGLKVGLRRRYYGVFAKVRPGFVTSPDTLNSTSTSAYKRNINLALDTGAVIEIYPSAGHFVMRLDFGEAGTRYSPVNVATPNGNVTQPLAYGNAGLYIFGVGWRF